MAVKKKPLQIAVQIVIPGGKNVVKVMTVRKATLKVARGLCSQATGECKNCQLKGCDMCETILYDDGYLKDAAAMLNALFDGGISKTAKKHKELDVGI